MRTLASKIDRDAIAARIASLAPGDRRRWGKMSVGQMMCHLCDAYHAALGETRVAPSSNFFRRTFMKWAGLWAPIRWPHNIPTRPEIEQGVGGTPPVEFGHDQAKLLAIFRRFCDQLDQKTVEHPYFGPMSANDWARWGYLHADHHLRQFGH
jgi:hypothetical protein